MRLKEVVALVLLALGLLLVVLSLGTLFAAAASFGISRAGAMSLLRDAGIGAVIAVVGGLIFRHDRATDPFKED